MLLWNWLKKFVASPPKVSGTGVTRNPDGTIKKSYKFAIPVRRLVLSGKNVGQDLMVTIRQATRLQIGGATVAATIADNVAPTVPTGLQATAVSSSQINLSWNASTDTGGVMHSGVAVYRLRRNGSFLVDVNAPTTTYNNTGLSSSTNYVYTVAARDVAGNESAQSSSANATTQAGSGNNNPDGWATTGSVYINRNYNTENASEVGTANPVFNRVWVSNIGRGGSGAWKCYPVLPGGEQNCGWPNNWGSATPRKIFHSFTMLITQGMFDNAWSSGGMKFLDLRQVNLTSMVQHRWCTFLENQGAVFRLGFAAGGAGTALYNDGVNTNLDLAPLLGQFVWFCIMYDEENTSAYLYYKRQGDAGVTKALFRDETTVFGSEFFGSTGAGWNPLNAISLAGYWQFGAGIPENPATDFMVIDDLVIADHWTGPVW